MQKKVKKIFYALRRRNAITLIDRNNMEKKDINIKKILKKMQQKRFGFQLKKPQLMRHLERVFKEREKNMKMEQVIKKEKIFVHFRRKY